ASLEAALGRAVAGTGQVIGVVAEAGVGKSRLCHEFTERARTQGIAVYDAHCVAHGKMIPFLPVLELLRGYFGITDQDGDEAARRKVAGTLLLLDPELTDALPLLLEFLGVPDPERPVPRMDPEARQRQLFELIRRLVHARSRREPAVLLIDDLHWIDGASEGFVETIIEALSGTRTLFLVNFRPEYHAGWTQKSYYQQLPLLPLGPEAIAELLASLLGTDPSLAGLVERMRERTRGNPFFIEEVVQSLLEAGTLQGTRGSYRLARPVAEVTIPATVQAVLAARIDRLPEREKQIVQTAAVIGTEFSEPILQAAVELPLSEPAGARRGLVGDQRPDPSAATLAQGARARRHAAGVGGGHGARPRGEDLLAQLRLAPRHLARGGGRRVQRGGADGIEGWGHPLAGNPAAGLRARKGTKRRRRARVRQARPSGGRARRGVRRPSALRRRRGHRLRPLLHRRVPRGRGDLRSRDRAGGRRPHRGGRRRGGDRLPLRQLPRAQGVEPRPPGPARGR